jgi:hypothetical protein
MTETNDQEQTDLPSSTRGELALDAAAVISSAVPWIGGPVSAVLSGMSVGRKFDRVREVLDGLATDLKDVKSELSEQYVKTEEFQELLEKTLLKAADERSEEKRNIYRQFLTDVIQSPCKSYDEQIRFLRTLEEVQPDHIRILMALAQAPDNRDGFSGSPSATLSERLPQMSKQRIADLVSQVNDLRITNLTSLNTMMTYRGAQDLRHSITSYGQRFLKFIVDDN